MTIKEWAQKLNSEDVIERCRKESEGLWKDGKPEKWYYALPFPENL